MALVPVEHISLEQLLFPVRCADRQLSDLHLCLDHLIDMEDHLEDFGAHAVVHQLQLTVQHLRTTILYVKLCKLQHLVRFQRALHIQWTHHQLVPPIEFDLD